MIEESDRRKGGPDTHFKLWQAVPANMLYPLVTEIRKRKGLSPEPPNPAEYIDKGWSRHSGTEGTPEDPHRFGRAA